MSLRYTSAAWCWFLLLAVAVLVLVFAVEPILGHDLFWHLKSGEVMFANHEILRSDIFSYTAFGAPWVNSEWLSQILIWILYKLAGLNAFIAYKAVLVGAIATFVYAASRTLGLSKPASAWAAVTVILFSHMRIQARPHLIGDALTAFYAFIIYRYIAGKQRRLWILLPIQVFWANVHGSALFGVEMLVLVAAGESLQALFSSGPPALDRKRRVHLVVIAVLAAVACLANPWGIGFYTFIFGHLLKMKAILGSTWEWTPSSGQPLDKVIFIIAFRIFLVVTLASFIAGRKRVRLSHLFMVVVVSIMAFKASRFVAQFFIICTPIAFANFRNAFKANRPRWAVLPVWMHAAMVLNVALFFSWFGVPIMIDLKSRRHVGVGLEEKTFPVNAVDFLEQNDIHGRVLNEMHWGGYLIFKRWPGERVQIDGRTPVYGDEFYREFTDAFRSARNFEEYLDRFDIDYILLAAKYARPFRYLHRFLRDSPRWKLVLADGRSYIYLKGDPKFEKVIGRYAMKRHPLFK